MSKTLFNQVLKSFPQFEGFCTPLVPWLLAETLFYSMLSSIDVLFFNDLYDLTDVIDRQKGNEVEPGSAWSQSK